MRWCGSVQKIIKQLNDDGIYLFVVDGQLRTKTANATITEQQGNLIRGNKDALIAYLQSPAKEGRLEIAARPKDADMPLSFAQQRLWMLDSIEGGSAHYNISSALVLHGTLDSAALQKAFHTILVRHESLRTLIVGDDLDNPLQQVVAPQQLPAPNELVPYCDIAGLDDAQQQTFIRTEAQKQAKTAFSLANDLKLRALLIKQQSNRHLLMVTVHHIASDGWSMAILIREFTKLYAAYVEGKGDPLPPLAVQYADYAYWQRQWLQGAVLEDLCGYWQQQLADLPVLHNLPTDFPRPQNQQYDGGFVHSTISPSQRKALQSLSGRVGGTEFTGLYSVFALLVARLSNQNDIVIGSPIANREQAQVKDLIGFFVNTLVLRCQLSPQTSFNQLLAQNQQMLLQAYDHQQLPFEQVVERLGVQRSLSHSPLFQVMLALQNDDGTSVSLPQLSVEPLAAGNGGVSHFDLTLNVRPWQDGFQLVWEYSTHLFAEQTIERFAEHFSVLLDGLLAEPEKPAMAVDMIPAAERNLLLDVWNNTACDYSAQSTIVELFERQAENRPHHSALRFAEQSLSYEQLNAKANRLARHMLSRGWARDNGLVGLCFERSIEMVVSILAILKAGGAYLPLDPKLPEARLSYMVADSGLTGILTSSHLSRVLPFDAVDTICLDDEQLSSVLEDFSDAALGTLVATSPQDLAYMLYTSGSTGAPKGVLIEHGGLVNLTEDLKRRYRLSAEDVMLLFAPVSFDMSVEEIFPALCSGCTLVIREDHWLDSVERFYQCCRDYQISVLNLPTAFWHELAWDEGPFLAEQVRHISVGGDKINPAAATHWYQKPGKLPALLNAYGPTECTVNASFAEIKPGSNSIGNALQNTKLYVLNQNNALAGIGVAGQLCVAGIGLARGYHNQPQLTAKQFIDNPFYRPGDAPYYRRLYCTGDLARWSEDGEIECLGRVDHQIKIRGFRIELGEIEAVIKSFSDPNFANVKDTLVVVESDNSQQTQLFGYVVVETPQLLDEPETLAAFEQALRGHLQGQLAAYMVPTRLIFIAEFPMTANGKIDRKALPRPQNLRQAATIVAPRNDTERDLLEIWSRVLNATDICISDDFFARGGHSLLAMRLVSAINKAFAIEFPLRAVFSHGVLAEQAEQIARLRTADNDNSRLAIGVMPPMQHKPLSFTQLRLWMLCQIEGDSSHYNMPSAVKLRGTLDLDALSRACIALIERHQVLRTQYHMADNGQPYQRVLELAELGLDQTNIINSVDLSALSEAQLSEQVSHYVAAQAAQCFDLENDLMLRVQLLRLPDEQFVLLLTTHHIACDGWSTSILIEELCQLYHAFVQQQPNPLAPLSLQYVDYAYWQRQFLQGDELTRQLAYWQQQLCGIPSVHSLPLDKVRPQQQRFVGANYVSRIDNDLSAALLRFCQSHNATLFMGLYSVFATLLARLSHGKDIVIGTAVANRDQEEIAELVGFFVNTLVLRCDLSQNPDFEQLLDSNRHMLLDAYAHQQVPFEQLVEALKPERSLSYSPLFQVMLVLQNTQESTLALPGLSVAQLQQSAAVAKYDLTLNVTELADGLALGWQYNSDLFESSSIELMAQSFESLLRGMLKQPRSGVLSAPILSAEQQQKLRTWNETEVAFNTEQLAHQAFEHMASVQPHAVAVIDGQQQFSYQSLNQQANRLARLLVERYQVKPDTRVGICLARGSNMVVSILAVLKAAGAYVPLEPQYPAERLAYIIDNSGVAAVLTEQQWAQDGQIDAQLAICLDTEAHRNEVAGYRDENLGVSALNSQHLAYVIYTSGSTGQPKGVMVEHRALVNRIDWMQRQYGCDASDKILQKTPFSFDVSVWEFIWPLSAGATMVLAKPQGHKDPHYLSELIAEQQITKLHFVPSMLASMLSLGDLAAAKSLRQVFCSGEALALNHVELFKLQCPDVALHNLYGPTEAAIDVSYWDCAGPLLPGHGIPIGRPISNIQLQVCDDFGQPVPIGALGELYIGGVGLARGYINQPQLTAERFIFDQQQTRWYKTGDLVRWQSDGQLAYLGRMDHQVKIRGLRIELGEIETVLTGLSEVREAVVIADDTEQNLVAYLVLNDPDRAPSNQTLIRQLSRTLPDYMVPQLYHVLPAMPVTNNGKLDRKALPKCTASEQAVAYVAPQSPTQCLVADIWSAVLAVDKPGLNDNFFALGGHSLRVMEVIANLRQRGVSATARLVFSHPLLGDFADAIDANTDVSVEDFVVPDNLIPEHCLKITPQMLNLIQLNEAELTAIAQSVSGGEGNIQDIYPLGPLQQGMLFHHIAEPENDPYVMSSLFSVADDLQLAKLVEALQFVIDRHDILRTAVVWQGLTQPVQVVLRHAPLQQHTLNIAPEFDIKGVMQGLCLGRSELRGAIDGAEHIGRFDLTSPSLLRLTCAWDALSERHYVLLELHHIIADHVTLDIVKQEANAYCNGLQASLAPAVPYRAYIAHCLARVDNQDAASYFADMLGDVDSISAPFGIVDIRCGAINDIQIPLDRELASALRRQCQQQGMAAAAYFHAAWALVLAACCDRQDVVFGTVLSGRLQGIEGGDTMPGVFINTLPVRVKLAAKTVEQLLRQTNSALHQLLNFEYVSLAQAQRHSALASDAPLFTAMINYRHSRIDAETAAVEQEPPLLEFIAGQERSNYPLSLLVDDFADDFALTIQAADSIDAQQVGEYVVHVLTQLCNPEVVQLSQIDVVPPAQRQTILAMSNHQCLEAASCAQNDETLVTLFEAIAERHQASVALVFEQQQLSYQQLNCRANQLAFYLQERRGIKPGDLVGICLERGIDTIVAILAVLKAGGAYVPLDPDMPASRVEYILQQAKLDTVLTHSALCEKLTIDDAQALCLDSLDWRSDSSAFSKGPVVSLSADSPAYVIFTSGSTGQPKGVVVSHHNVVRLLSSAQTEFAFDHQDVWTLFHSFAFDFSVWEIWGALAFGGRLVIVPYWVSRSPSDFYDLVLSQQVTVLNQTPSAFTAFIQNDIETGAGASLALRYVVFGGEALNFASLKPWFAKHGDSQPKLINMYGITETTVHVTFGRVDLALIAKSHGASIIGQPLSDLSVLILDEQQKLLPPQVAGEMYVGGAGVTLGYLEQPGLSAERFVHIPHLGAQRFYRTGDIGRYRSDGELEYLGRRDSQVKIRGFRIELGEIQHALMAFEGVNDAYVMTQPNDTDDNDRRIVAYLVGSEDLSVASVREHLSAFLPNYMIPAAFAILPALPLTGNGKVDVARLPSVDAALAQQSYEAPCSALQATLCDVWQQVLDIEQVGINDNYFALGGDSILAIRLVAQAKMQQIELSIEQLFKAPTIAHLSALIVESDGETRGLQQVEPFSLIDQEERAMLAAQIADNTIVDAYPLSLTQQGMVFHHLMYQGQGVYHDLFSTKMSQSWSLEAFEQALGQLVEDNELLRSIVFEQGKRLLHTIQGKIELPLEVVDLRQFTTEQQQAELRAFAASDVVSGFSPGKPLWYITIHRLGDDHFQFSLSFHHALLDGWSVATMQANLLKLYLQALAPEPSVAPNNPERPLPYRQFIAQELEMLADEGAANYWQAQLADCRLPWWTGQEKTSSGHCQVVATERQSALISQLAKTMQIHEKSIFMAIHLQLLSALNGGEDLTTSVVFNGRPEGSGSELTLGLFLNTLPFNAKLGRNNIDDTKATWQDWIAAIDGQLLELSRYRKYPLAKIQQQSGLDFAASLFNYVNFHIYDRLEGLVEISGSETFEQTNYLYGLTCANNGGRHILSLKLDGGIFSEQAIERIQGYLEVLLESVCSAPQGVVNQLELASLSERQQWQHWNNTDRDFDREVKIHQLFEQQVSLNPGQVAVKFDDRQLSYAELNQRANRLAGYLIAERGVRPDTLVGICMERSIDMVVAILAVLKAGGAYVPLDPKYPLQRIQYMLGDSALKTVLSQHRFSDCDIEPAQLFDKTQAVYLDEAFWPQLDTYPADDVQVSGLTSRHLAYVIYTSGSTGQPKGVMVEHQALVNRIGWMQRQYGCDNSDTILQKTPFSFDVSVWEFMWPLTTGARMVLAKPGGHLQPDYLVDLIASERVTKVHFVPSMLASLLNFVDVARTDSGLGRSLAQVFCSGEALALSHVEQFKRQCPQVALHNLYGPTEAAIDVSYWDCSGELSRHHSVPIGRPIDNIQLKVVDRKGQLAVTGAPGELYIGGVGLARGYLNRGQMTKERFVVDGKQRRWYRTGDLVRWSDCGQLIYLGRLDHQVKIRGFRIELGEIEAALNRLASVKESLVVAAQNAAGEPCLVGYVVLQSTADDNRGATSESLKSELAQQLPEYMVPALLMMLPAIPVTSNGKADRNALPKPDFSALQIEYVAPSNEIEQQLADIWQQILGLERIGVDDNFFTIGGHSLSVVQLLVNINRQFEMEVTLKQFFDAQTIRTLGRVISTHQIINDVQFTQQDQLGENEMELTL